MTPEQENRIREAIARAGSVSGGARIAGVSWHTANRYAGDQLTTVVSCPPPDAAPDPAEMLAEALQVPRERRMPESTADPTPEAQAAVLAGLRRRPMSMEAIASKLDVREGRAREWIEAQRARGLNLESFGGLWEVTRVQPTSRDRGRVLEYVSEPDNTFHFGACGDAHLCSKYSREDCLERLYDRYEEEGIGRVFNTGNYIDGEARFNKHDLHVHGMDAQLRYLAEKYPRRPGITNYVVSGDDHEGWYCQNAGVDIGKYAEVAMRDAGREDWVDIGYMEAHVRLVNANSGASSVMAVVHPGGGSAYALSYSIQKIIESYEGGSKPAVGLYGHYHKLMFANIRNVWALQTGTCQDQTPFMRKKRLEAHVGGCIVKLKQDPESGAITECTPTILRYFGRGFYNDRWSHSHPVTLPERG